MKIILLSGGAGKRLWPLSGELLPKQFMKVLKDDSGSAVSMLQKAYRLLAGKFGASGLYVAAHRNHESVLKEQLGSDIRLILEPSQRDTFPAIALAAAHLASDASAAPGETVVVVPADTYTDDRFYELIPQLDELIRSEAAALALIGVRPDEPAEKYGYILPEPPSGMHGCSLVRRFYEKPDAATAAELIRQGALWNSGVFAFKLDYMLAILQRHHYPSQFRELHEAYDSLPRISFDYMVVEQEKRIVCAVYEGKWTDLGTWSEMLHVLAPESSDLVIADDNCRNTHVINQLGIPIIIAGISNAVIAAGPDGILISDKRVSHTIKPLIDRLPPP